MPRPDSAKPEQLANAVGTGPVHAPGATARPADIMGSPAVLVAPALAPDLDVYGTSRNSMTTITAAI